MSDWTPIEKLSEQAQDVVRASQAAASQIIEESGNAGWAMRGMIIAIAAAFETHHLDRGLASSLRATHNAFDDRRRDLGLVD